MPTEPTREQPTRVGERYELTSPISTGGMGQVWRGYDTVLDREIAVKLIRPDVARTPEETTELAARFRREAKVTARIEHSAVPAVYDADIDGPSDRLYLVMQLVHGAPLSDVVAEDAPLPVATAASIAAQVCSVLSYAHAVPAVHRDLKPSNVLIADEGAVKVLDFGIAAVLRTDVTRLTATGTKLGTFAYMPPEQVLGGGVSPASDLYSLGCVLYELCTGRRVFPGGTDYVVQDQHVKTAPTPPRELRPDLPEALERLVLHMLAKNPEERPADAQEVYGRIAPFLPIPAPAGEAEPAAPPGSLPDPTRPYRRPLAPRPRPAGTAATAPGPGLAPAPIKAPPSEDPGRPPAGSFEPGEPPRTLYSAGRLDEAEAQAQDLIDDERFAQAAGLLDDVVDGAAAQWGQDSDRLADLRLQRAFALGLSGDIRRALPEFDGLAAHFAAADGPDSERALECRHQAALCRAHLGESTSALRELQDVVGRMAVTGGRRDPAALDVRMEIGRLLVFTGRIAEARPHLEALHPDLTAEYGPGDPMAREAAELLDRIRRASG